MAAQRTHRRLPSRWLLAGYAATMALLSVAYFTMPTAEPLPWIAMGVLSAGAIVTGVVVHRPRRALPWLLFALGVLAFTAGDGAYLILTDVQREISPFPSIADGFYLAMYPLIAAGLLLLPQPVNGRDRASMVDALVLTAGCGLLVWIFLVEPYLDDSAITTPNRLTMIAYPLADIAVLAVGAHLLSAARRSPTLILLAIGGVALLTTDVIYAAAQLRPAMATGDTADVGWAIFYIAWGAAALHPSMTELTEPRARPEAEVTAIRLVVLTCSALIAPVVLLFEAGRGLPVDGVAIAVLSGVIFLLVLLRLAGVVRRLRQAGQRERTLRETGAALVSATDVRAVQQVVDTAVARLVPADTAYEMTMPLRADTLADDDIPKAVRDAAMEASRQTRFVRTDLTHSAQAQKLRAHELALVIPLTVTGRSEGRTVLGNLAVAADDRLLTGLQQALEVVAAQAALAIERIALTDEVARRDTEQYFRTLVQNTSDVIMIINDDDTVRYATPSAATLFGDQQPIGRRISDLVVSTERDLARYGLDQIHAGIDPPGLAFWTIPGPDGQLMEVEVAFRDLRDEPTVNGIVFTVRDVTAQRRLDRELTYLAFHDSLTGLANRTQFTERVRQAVSTAAEDDVAGVLFIDVDDFKMVNDSMGHEIGDRLLMVVARRLATALPPTTTAARIGGDEFAVLVEHGARASDVEKVADLVVAALAEPVTLGGSVVSSSASIGLATTEDTAPNNDLLRRADMALYMAKGAGKGLWRRYQPGLHAAIVKRMELRSALERAVNRDEFLLAYQPIVRLADGALSGLEALLRWMDPDRGLVLPGEFIDVAEDSGLIVPIGDWALERALSDAASWADPTDDRAPYLSLNISVRQFHRPSFIARIREELRNSGLPPQRLTLEITESLLLRDDARVWHDLTQLRDLGIRVAIDDFGTGYSSLSYLRQVAIDLLKIDKSFIDSMATSDQQRALVHTIVQLAQTLGLDVIAEGVSRAEDRDLLVGMGCPYGQGYLFARPMNQEQTLRWLRTQRAAQHA